MSIHPFNTSKKNNTLFPKDNKYDTGNLTIDHSLPLPKTFLSTSTFDCVVDTNTRIKMTFCENCNCHLGGTNREIMQHLDVKHGVHVRLGEDSHLAYCNDCHKYLGKKKNTGLQQFFIDQRQALEKHLVKQHNITMHEGSMD